MRGLAEGLVGVDSLRRLAMRLRDRHGRREGCEELTVGDGDGLFVAAKEMEGEMRAKEMEGKVRAKEIIVCGG